jgi:hypothetical protein
MSENAKSENRSSAPQDELGVLRNLPRTRPQRSSPRRAAARDAASGGERAVEVAHPKRGARKPKATTAPPGRRTRTTTRRDGAPAPGQPSRSARDAAPRQGFEPDSDAASGPVQPPGGAELVASAVEILGELAKGGLSTGERLLKDLISRLPLS